MDHQRIRPCGNTCMGQRQRVRQSTSNARDNGDALVNQVTNRLHHRDSFGRGQAVKFARIAVHSQDINTRRNGAINDGDQTRRVNRTAFIKGGDQNSRHPT